MNQILLTREGLDVAAITQLVSHASCGGISLFVGTTRDNFEGKTVLSLEYEAYEPMARKQMESICEKIRARWTNVVNVVIHHRLGVVPMGEASVVIAVSSPHRQCALDGVAFAIEELKKHVPIWKKEVYDENDSTWKENNESPVITKVIKRQKLDFTACTVQNLGLVPQNFVQIAAEDHEIQRRIQCFVEKKRDEIDINNILDFTMIKPGQLQLDIGESTCARTNSSVVKQEHSKCHLRVRRVENRTGPQTKPNYLQALDKLMTMDTRLPSNEITHKPKHAETVNSRDLPFTTQQRLYCIEQHLSINTESAPKNQNYIFSRIKAIEDRILYLESISPEYKNFLIENTDEAVNFANSYQDRCAEYSSYKRKSYTVDDIKTIIEHMQQ